MLTLIIPLAIMVYIIGAVFVTIAEDTYHTRLTGSYFGDAPYWPYHFLRWAWRGVLTTIGRRR
jgi:hypothetical protein